MACRLARIAHYHGLLSPKHCWCSALSRQSVADLAAAFIHNTEDMAVITEYNVEYKITFASEKMELIHFTRKHHGCSPPVIVGNTLTVQPTITTEKPGQQPAICWLEVWFDRKLTFKCHVQEHTSKARGVAQHIHSLAHTINSPPAVLLQKVVIICVLPTALYSMEAWYKSRKKYAHIKRAGRSEANAGLDWHINMIDKVLALAARGVFPIWRTSPFPTLFQDAGLLSAAAALEE